MVTFLKWGATIAGVIFFSGQGVENAGEGVEKASNGVVKLAFSAAVLAGLWYWFTRR